MIPIARRSLLAGGAVAVAAGAVLPRAATAQTAATPTQAPGFYRTRVGEAVVTALLDGYIDVAPDLWTGTSPEALRRAMRARFLDPDAPRRISVNAYVVETAGQVVAIDAGADTLFGPTAGRHASALAAAGYGPEAIDRVVLTHLHPDHIGGLIAGEAAVFPNAEIVVETRDLAFWTAPEAQAAAPDFARPWFDAARRMATLYGDRLAAFSGEAVVAPGIQAVDLAGHTPGHSGFLLESAGERLFFWGDVSGLLPLQLDDPDAGLVFDVDGEAGARSRRKAFDLAVAERLQIAGSHVPFPSFGYIAEDAGRRYYVAAEWRHEI